MAPTGVPANCAGLVVHGLKQPVRPVGTDALAVEASAQRCRLGDFMVLAYHINVASAAAFGFEPTAIDDWGDYC